MFDRRRYDDIDLMIMKMVGDNSSVREMSQAVGRGVSSVHSRLNNLEEAGLVKPPPKKNMHRARQLTQQGEYVLSANRIIKLPK